MDRLQRSSLRGRLGVAARPTRAFACLPAGASRDAATGPRRSQRPTRAPCSLAACVQVGQLYVSQEAPAPAACAQPQLPKRRNPSSSKSFPPGKLAASGSGQRPDSSWASCLAARRLSGSDDNSSSLGPRLVLGKPTGPPMSRLGHASRQVTGAMVEQGSRKAAIKSPYDSATATAAVGVKLVQTAAPVPPSAAKPTVSKPARGAVLGSRTHKRKKMESAGEQHQLYGLGTAEAGAATACNVQLLEHLYGAGRAPAGGYFTQKHCRPALSGRARPDGSFVFWAGCRR